MTDTAPSAAPAAPSAPSNTGPGSAPLQSGRGRVSSFEQAMEAKNAAAAQRANQRSQQAPALENRTQQQPARPAQAGSDRQAPAETGAEQQLLGAPEPDEGGELEQQEAEPALTEEAPEQQQPDATAEQQAMAEAWREFKDTGALPEAFMSGKVAWTDANGLAREETVEELKQGAMRLSEFHRGMQGLRQAQQGMAERDQNVRAHFERIKDPQAFLDEYQERGYGAVLNKVVDLVTAQRDQRKAVIEAAGYRVMQQYQCDGNDARVIDAMQRTRAQLMQAEAVAIENRRIKRENEILAKQAQARQADQMAQQNMAQLEHSLNQLLPMALRASGIFDSPTQRSKVVEHLKAYVGTLQNWDGTIRREHVLAAARIRREELEFERAQQRGQRPKPKAQKPVSRALPPSASQGASRSGSAQPAGPGRKRPSDMANDPRFGGNLG